MSNAVFPSKVRGLTWSVTKSPEFSTIVHSAPNFCKTRIAQTQNPVWHFDLIFDYLKNRPADLVSGLTYTDYQTLMGFLLARRGQFDDFLFSDPYDKFAGPALIASSPNPNAELPLVTDGVNYFSPLQRTWAEQFSEDITDLDASAGALKVYDNGVLQANPADYTLHGPGLVGPGYSYNAMYLQWTAMPTGPVTAEFGFYFRVALEADRQDFEQFMSDLFSLGGMHGSGGGASLKFMTSRTPAV